MFKRRAKVPTEKQLQPQGGHQPKQAVLRADYEPSFDGCLAAPAGRVVTATVRVATRARTGVQGAPVLVVAPVLAAPWTAVAVVRWVEAVEVSLRRRTRTSRSK